MKTTNQKIQKRKVGVAGLFTNQLMGNNATLPVVGEGGTILHYSDRDCVEVLEVSEDGLTVKVEHLNAVANPNTKNDIGHKNWILESTGQFSTIVWKNGAWRYAGHEVRFTKEFRESIPSEYIGMWLRKNNPELADRIYNGDTFPSVEIEGITKTHKIYNKISILWGVKDYHYDWSF